MINRRYTIKKPKLERLIEEYAIVYCEEFGEIELNPKTCRIYEDIGHFTKRRMGWCLSFEHWSNGKMRRESVNVRDLRERRF